MRVMPRAGPSSASTTCAALRALQFPEDAGPMAHPVRPDSYQEISNFYTATVYEKGAEVVRMLQTLVGVDGFRRGMDLYFKRHDGQAVTCDDFVAAMAMPTSATSASSGAGMHRPARRASRWAAAYDPTQRIYELTLHPVDCRATPGSPAKEPFHIPLPARPGRQQRRRTAPCSSTAKQRHRNDARARTDAATQQTLRFINVGERPVPSLLREFSAPVIVDYDYTDAELAFLCQRTTPIPSIAGRRDSAWRRHAFPDDRRGRGRPPLALDDAFVDVFRTTLLDPALAPAFKEQALTAAGRRLHR